MFINDRNVKKDNIFDPIENLQDLERNKKIPVLWINMRRDLKT